MPTLFSSSRRHAHGLSLVEALVAVLVLSLGLLVVAQMQPRWRAHAELARQRSEATRLAQQEIERLRAGAEAVDAVRDLDADAAGPTTAYRLERRIDAAGVPNATAVAVTVGWTNRGGEAHAVRLDSVVARLDPILSGAVALAPRGGAIAGPSARSIAIPLGAKDLGDGRSVLKPTTGATEAWVFDNRSGLPTGRCTGIAATKATAELATSDLSACTSAIGMLVSGEVHFSAALPPSAESANDPTLPLSVELVLEGGAPAVAPWCVTEAVATGDERYVAYRCVVIPPVGVRGWSGRTSVVPAGWSIGTGAADWRVCRYARDLDGSGAVDANAEHPPIYQNVDRTLPRQNFLVVRGNAPCPGPADGRTAARSTTEPHQP